MDYTRTPNTTGSAAIDPRFNATSITNMAGQVDYAFYWSSTTHANQRNGANAAYVTFGRGLGTMDGTTVIDVHGAGCQRSDPKQGDPADYPSAGNGPQGDVRRVFNYVRLVRDGAATLEPDGDPTAARTGAMGASTGSEPPDQPEAIEACAGLTEGAACAFESPHGQMAGACVSIQEQIVCVPEGWPGKDQPPGP